MKKRTLTWIYRELIPTTTSGKSIVQRAEIVDDDEAVGSDSSGPEWSSGTALPKGAWRQQLENSLLNFSTLSR